jgi:hypothetical protein
LKLNTPKFLLWDADYLIYRVGFAVNDTEPVEYALATVKSSINGVLDRVANTGHQLYLTGKGNFRDTLGTIQVYKGNRDPADRPYYYQEIKDYLINHQGAIVVTGQEADDEVGIRQWEKKDRSTCIVGQDKDLKMIPGWHYNPVKDESCYITLPEANTFFFFQMLTGDRTDNIPGIKGIGDVRAAKLLGPVKGDIIKMKDVVFQKYREQYGEAAESAYAEVSNLLWIRREEDQVCPF